MSTYSNMKAGNVMIQESKIFYKKTLTLVIPMALQNLINVGISSIDVIMLGKVGEKVLSGASLGAQVQFIMGLLLFGVTSGASVLMAQYWGKRDMRSIETVFAIAVKMAFAAGVLFTAAAFTVPHVLMSLFTNDSAVRANGVIYLRIVCFSYIPNALTMVYLNSMRSMEKVVIGSVTYFSSLVTNVVVNSLLIFGYFGLPKLGIMGAAAGTVAARLVEFIIVVIYDRKINDVFRFRFSHLGIKNKGLERDFFKISSPVIANELMWGLGLSTIAAILGHLGSAATAANSVAQVCRNLATVVAFGVASAAAVMIGKVIGEGNKELAREYGGRFIKITIATGIAGSIVILCVRPVVLSVLSLSDDARKLLSVMLFIMAYYVIAQAYNTTLIVGIFRGGGDTKFGFFLDMAFMWGVSILLGFIAAFVLELPAVIIAFILYCDEVIKIPASTWRYKSYKWLNDVTRDG